MNPLGKTKLVALVVLLAPAAWPDCADGARSTTEAEKQFYMQTFNSVRALVPPAPAGWRMEDLTKNITAAPNSVCTGTGKLPVQVSYDIRYVWEQGIAERRAKEAEFDKQVEALRQLPPAQQQEVDELTLKSRAMGREARKLMSTDKAQAEKLVADSRELDVRVRAIKDAHMQAISDQLTTLSKRQIEEIAQIPVEVRLHFNVNNSTFPLPEKGQKTSFPGATVAFAGPTESVYGFGKWSQQAQSVKPVYNGANTQVHNIVIKADGNPKQVEQLISTLQPSALTQLLQ